jgi:uncharacterized protein YjbI with pentapeptide repeats
LALRSFFIWATGKRILKATTVISVALALGTFSIWVGYLVPWTGFAQKTIWDWLSLLLLPSVLALVALRLYTLHNRTEREIAVERSQEVSLQAYLDFITQLLLKEGLQKSKPEDEVRLVGRATTLIELCRLNGKRKGILLRFLQESKLLQGEAVIDLGGADLRKANLEKADLQGANLEKADLGGADLRKANLEKADLQGANLEKADLSDGRLGWAKLERANLSEVNLSKADLEGADLKHAYLFKTDLGQASLSKADLEGASLAWANLSGADLSRANMVATSLTEAELERANLSEVNLSKADLRGVSLKRSNLEGAVVSTEQLASAKSLSGATMPDGSVHV